MRNINLIISIIAILCQIQANAQTLTDTHTRIFDKSFKSLRASVVGNDYAPPVIKFGSTDKIKIEFDQLSPEMQYLRYSVVHCDANWQPSQLVDSEYTDGFNEANVENYSFSSATFAHYVHYDITIPNDDMNFLVSGNYLLKVYPEEDSETTYLQVRFSLSEDCIDIIPEITSRTDIDYNKANQQLSIEVDTREYYVDNMYEDLKISIIQNSRTDNMVSVNHPMRVAGRKAFFEHNRDLIFPAGNEFRRFEMTTTNYAGMGIEGYAYHDPYYHVILKTDEPRAFGSYIYDRTQYGRFTIRYSDAYDSDTEADYMIVHFQLRMPELNGGKMYVDGEFTQHNFESANLMHYNHNTQCYELDLMLKQGAYNYQYLWVPDGTSVGKTSTVEGDFYQTVNEYQIMVYNRKRGERYDRLIGTNIIYSGE